LAAVQRLNLPPVILKAAGGKAAPDHKPSEPVAVPAPLGAESDRESDRESADAVT
jgi:hypothetical protein